MKLYLQILIVLLTLTVVFWKYILIPEKKEVKSVISIPAKLYQSSELLAELRKAKKHSNASLIITVSKNSMQY